MSEIEDKIKKLEIEDIEEAVEQKSKRGRKKGSTTKQSKPTEYAELLSMIFNFLCKITQVDYKYTSSDFIIESEMITNISKKYDMIGRGLELASPIILIIAMCEKGYNIYNLKKKKPEQVNQQKIDNPYGVTIE